jgi:hypothetical protein
LESHAVAAWAAIQRPRYPQLNVASVDCCAVVRAWCDRGAMIETDLAVRAATDHNRTDAVSRL